MWHWYWIIPLSILMLIAAAVLTVTCICFFKIFYARRKKPTAGEEIPVLPGRAFDPYRARIAEWIRETRAIPHKDVTVTSFDGLRLCGKYYEQKKGAPIEILFHGYRGSAERDLCGGVYRCFALGRNALIVDQRASGNSEGHVITFGNKESRDCQTWANFVVEQIDKDARIILTGISMGAATVMTAASLELPEPVQRITLYIQQNYDREISNTEISAALGYHSFYLNRIFKKSTGITIHQAVLREKMRVAKRLLRDTALPVHSIAAEVGFPERSQFCTLFRRQVGCTPTEYRCKKNTV